MKPTTRNDESSNVLKRIGDRMQKARLGARDGKGFTQQELASLLKVTSITLSRWETGNRNPSFEVLKKFANEVEKPMAYFFEEETQESDSLHALFRSAKNLTDEDLEEALNYINYLYEKSYRKVIETSKE